MTPLLSRRLRASACTLLALLGLAVAPPAARAITAGDPGPPPGRPAGDVVADEPGGPQARPAPLRRAPGSGLRPLLLLPEAGRSWPVSPAAVVAEIDLPDPDWLPGHRGLDLAAEAGQPVVSAARGQVAFAGRVAGRGVVVVATGTWRAVYEPVAASVSVGDPVAAGDVLGALAPDGGHCGVPSPCLHWGLRTGEHYLDPRWLLAPPRPVLLSLPPPRVAR